MKNPKRIELLSRKLRECAATDDALLDRLVAARAERNMEELHACHDALDALRDQAEAWRTEYARLVHEMGPLGW